MSLLEIVYFIRLHPQLSTRVATDDNPPDVVARAERSYRTAAGLGAEGDLTTRASESRDSLASFGSGVGSNKADGGSEGDDGGETHGGCRCELK